MDLMKFVKRNVVLVDDNGKEWRGFVVGFTSAINNDEEYDSIQIETPQFRKGLVEFFENEIISIEIVSKNHLV